MALISMHDVCWGFDDPPLLENINLQIEKSERVCLLGRNGAGKSTLLKMLNAEVMPDSGEIRRQQGIRIASLAQEVPHGFDGTIFETVAMGLGETGRALAQHHRICRQAAHVVDSITAGKREHLQQFLDAQNGWALVQPIESILSRTGLDPEQQFASLSAGMKRRTLFAGALALSPDLLLLDEPTNHLDIDAIIWMEEYILRHVRTLLLITHDRAFLQRIATRVLELDRGRLYSYACDYGTYLQRKEAALEAEAQQNRVFEKKLSQEEVWIRQGIKARRTRNEGRVRALEKMRAAARARRVRTGNVRLQLQEAEKTGKLVIEVKSVSCHYDQNPILSNFSTLIMRGDKIGIIGPNGAGKTTLLKILLKEIEPESGSVRHGTHLQAAYFDQLRAQLDEQKTVAQNIGEGNDFIVFNGNKRHVISYLEDFLFTPDRCRTPVHVLSGGERNRLLLARLFTRPANVLVMDEPTNDLDAETLELLEELLFEFKGTLLLVSHDRAFLNNVVTSTLVFEEHAKVTEYAGGYDDWLLQRPAPKQPAGPEKKETPAKTENKPPAPQKLKKLGYMQVRELKELPRKIEALETEQNELYEIMSDPQFYKTEKSRIAIVQTRLDEVAHKIEEHFSRWEELEKIEKGTNQA